VVLRTRADRAMVAKCAAPLEIVAVDEVITTGGRAFPPRAPRPAPPHRAAPAILFSHCRRRRLACRYPHDHHGGVGLLPALADIGTAGFLADGIQMMLTHDVAGLRVTPADLAFTRSSGCAELRLGAVGFPRRGRRSFVSLSKMVVMTILTPHR
jgi:hypothetical protein